MVEKKKRKGALIWILGIIGLLALLIVAAAATGNHTGIAWLDNYFGNQNASGSGGGGSASSDGGGGGAGTAGNGCFLGFICLNASAGGSANGASGDADGKVDDDGVEINP